MSVESYDAIACADALDRFDAKIPKDARRWLDRLTVLRRSKPIKPPFDAVAQLIAAAAEPADVDRALAEHATAHHRADQHGLAETLCGQRFLAAVLADRDALHRQLAVHAEPLIERLHYAAEIRESVSDLTLQRRTDDAHAVVAADADAEMLRQLFHIRDSWLTSRPGPQRWSTGWWDCRRWSNPWEIGAVGAHDGSTWGEWRAKIRAGGRLAFWTWEQATAASREHEPNMLATPIEPIR